MAWSRFTYWRRDTWVSKPLTKVPKGSDKPLVYHQLKHGDFEPSPYLKMVDEEWDMFDKEIEELKLEYATDRDGFQDKKRNRLAVYNKRVAQLEREHWELDQKRIKMFKDGLKDAFGYDLWDEIMDKFPEADTKEFYKKYEQRAKEKNKSTTQRIRAFVE